ncbi:MAG: alanine:cation symporter family protein, partial [Chthoniobacterales bacterium]|nr:alanine:cation symporter family protein [Chthoniobacterales bacterium]
VKSIARACAVLVPAMVVFYVVGCVVILSLNASQLLEAVGVIVRSAFDPAAAGGGFAGAALVQTIRYGVTRGLFSNESGMGSGGFFAAAARTRSPVQQALVSMTGTFWDTVVICLLTGLVLVSSGAWQQTDTAGNALRGAELTTAAFAHIPGLGPVVLTVALLTFVLSTLFGWSYIGEKSAEYLFGERAVLPFRVVWVVLVYVGSVSALEFVWDFADLANGLMVIPNVVSLFLLSGFLARQTKAELQMEFSRSRADS